MMKTLPRLLYTSEWRRRLLSRGLQHHGRLLVPCCVAGPRSETCRQFASTRELTSEDIIAVRDSWAQFNKGDALTDATYIFIKLFSMAPEAAQLFYQVEDDISEAALLRNKELRQHVARVAGALGKAVEGLEKERLPDTKVFLTELGRRHAAYHVQARHFQSLGVSLMYALKRKLGPKRFTKPVQEAWKTVFGIVTDAMVTGLNEGTGKKTSK